MTNLLKMSQVGAKTGLSKSHTYALVQKGKFPKPVKLSAHASAWVEAEVDKWNDERIAKRDQEAA